MNKQRFEAPTLDLAVQAAKDALGDNAHIVGANRVRRGGVGGFFAKEYVEVEAEEPGNKPKGTAQASPLTGRNGTPSSGAGPKQPLRGSAAGPSAIGPVTSVGTRPQMATAQPGAVAALGPSLPDDALSDLIEEMAHSGPSSILDLAERVNTEQTRFALSQDNTPVGDMISAVRASDDFSDMLQRIAAEAGLLSGEDAGATGGPEIEVHHSGAILADLRESGHQGAQRPDTGRPDAGRPDFGLHGVGAGDGTPAPGVPAARPGPAVAPAGVLTSRHTALRQLGLPVLALPASLATGPVEQLEADLCAALEAALPPLPALPREATSVVAVVGERKDLLSAAKALAGELGTPAQEITLATRRGVWRQQQEVIASPEAASERKRGWRWRERPAVVAIETSVHPDGDAWVTAVLRALEPTMCVGVVEATRKPEDVAAWSQALGGLDALAVTDLGSTTSPAALLGGPVPVARADGHPATAAFWAHQLCARLR